MIRQLLSTAILLCGLSAAVADVMREIALADGSVIRAEVVGANGREFILKSPSLGEFRVPANDVVTIRQIGADGSAVVPPATADNARSLIGQLSTEGSALQLRIDPAAILRLQQSLMEDEQVMKSLQELRDDPSVVALLEDMALMSALMSGDLNAVQDHPKLKKLMENPVIKGIIEQYR